MAQKRQSQCFETNKLYNLFIEMLSPPLKAPYSFNKFMSNLIKKANLLKLNLKKRNNSDLIGLFNKFK